MVGHERNGYEGYNSTPSSPTKYTVNRSHDDKNDGHYTVSKQHLVIAAVVMVLALVTVFLSTYFTVSSTCDKFEPQRRQYSPFTNGNSNSEIKHETTTIFYEKSVEKKVENLTNDQIDIDVKSFMEEKNDEELNTTPIEFVSDKGADNENGNEDEDEEDFLREKNFRLPVNWMPIHYELRIIPFINNYSTIGEVNITMQCKNTTDKIVMNLKDIEIKKDVEIIISGTHEMIPIKSFTFDENNEVVIMYLKNQVQTKIVIYMYIRFSGSIRKMPNGLYISHFDQNGNIDSSMISTQMSPNHARSVYPSFDEPSFKAAFTISIGRQTNMFSLSNMKIMNTEPMQDMSNWVWDHYQTTPVMSTYLTAFLIAPSISLKENALLNSTSPEITLWTRPFNSYQTEISQKLTADLIKYFQRYFSIDFPLSKIDIVAVPSLDYEAMENWGLIIFKEERILVNKGNSVNSKQSLAFMLAHEIAHQWFGNLVTPEWWDELWLKEGFSSYFQYMAIDELYPDWEVFNEFTMIEMEKAFSSDALTTTHPINQEVKKPDKKIFDSISYHKGSSIIRMLAHFLGQEKLKNGLTSYLNNYSFSNAKQEDLWEFLSEDGYKYDVDKVVQLSTIMDSWTQQAGYPVITITRHYSTKTAEIRQERFLLNGKKDNSSSLWWVPISYTSRIEKQYYKTEPKYWLPAEEKMYISKLPNNESWILLNLQSTGFYRVNYDYENWILLITDFHNLAATAKAQLIKDSFNLARGGKLEYDIPLSMAAQLSRETEYLPWQAASQVFDFLKSSIIKMPAYEYFQLYVVALIRQVYTTLVQEVNESERTPWIVPDNPIAQRHAENIITLACSFQESHCVSTSKLLYHNWMSSPDNGNNVPVAIRSIIYCTAIREGGHREWEFAFDRLMRSNFQNAEDDFEKASLLKALGCSSKPWFSTKALSYLNANSGLDKKDGMILFKSVASNNVGHWIAHSFIQSEWERMLDFYGSPNAIYEMVCSVVDSINSPYEIKQLTELINKIMNKTEEKSNSLLECLERAENNKFWMETNYGKFSMWLESFIRSYKLI